jgi:regulator of protease activity HflC (stomatin/prohibitin superfamily)
MNTTSTPFTAPAREASQEHPFRSRSGFALLFVAFLLLVGSVTSFATIRPPTRPGGGHEPSSDASTSAVVAHVLGGLAALLGFVLVLPGFFVVAPNESRALVLFGTYRGTERRAGFWWTNPFTKKRRISLRAHTLNGKTLKVNDLVGNPIEIAAVVVWQVRDTAQALFDVEAYETYVETQSEAALRDIAGRHPYDEGHTTDASTSLRGSRDQVATELRHVLDERLARAGVEVVEARLSHLAYAPEIAGAMLQRQQAAAVIAARSMIVDGAVGMVEHALDLLAKRQVLVLDD